MALQTFYQEALTVGAPWNTIAASIVPQWIPQYLLGNTPVWSITYDVSGPWPVLSLTENITVAPDTAQYSFVLFFTELLQPFPYQYLFNDPAWYRYCMYYENYSDATYAQNLAFITDVVAPLRHSYVKKLTTQDFLDARIQSFDGTTQGFQSFNCVDTYSDGMGLYTEVYPLGVYDLSVVYTGKTSASQGSMDLRQNPPATQVGPSDTGLVGVVGGITKAINSLQTNVSVNHGQAIFSVQGGAITGP